MRFSAFTIAFAAASQPSCSFDSATQQYNCAGQYSSDDFVVDATTLAEDSNEKAVSDRDDKDRQHNNVDKIVIKSPLYIPYWADELHGDHIEREGDVFDIAPTYKNGKDGVLDK